MTDRPSDTTKPWDLWDIETPIGPVASVFKVCPSCGGDTRMECDACKDSPYRGYVRNTHAE